MSRIEFEQISDTEIEVVIPPETPMAMVQQLTKSFVNRGLVEDLQKSTLSVRYFYRPAEKSHDIADKLIKSLRSLAKDDELPYWHPKAQMANQKRVREMEIAERRAKNGLKQPTNVSPAPEPLTMPDAPAAPAAPTPVGVGGVKQPNVVAPKMYDNDMANQNTAGGTGKRYAYISDAAKADDEEDDIEKSGYGPKGGGQYTPTDNMKRKAKNLTDAVPVGPNSNVKAYSSKPGQMSGKAQASLTAKLQNAANKKQPVKIYSPEEKAALASKMKLNKGWGQHLPFPSAEEEIMNLAKNYNPTGEEASAQQLANLMSGKNMLGQNVHPAVKAMMAPPPPQPTDEQMFGHLAVSEEMVKAADQQWAGTLNNFFAEATKPISSRFASEEEEIAYWSKIRVEDRDDGKSGY